MPDQGAKSGAEGPQALITDSKADIRDGNLLARKQPFGTVDAQLREKFVRRCPEGLSEEAVIVIGGQACFSRGVSETDRLIEASR